MKVGAQVLCGFEEVTSMKIVFSSFNTPAPGVCGIQWGVVAKINLPQETNSRYYSACFDKPIRGFHVAKWAREGEGLRA